MLKRIAVLAVAAVGFMAVPAAAQQYPPETKTIAASDTTPCPGGPTTITGEGFDAGSTVTVTLDGTTPLGTPTAGDDGTVSLEVTIPTTTATGQHTIEATGTGISAAITATLNVVSCEEAPTTTVVTPGGSLPSTGSNSTMTLVRFGLALAAIGGVLLAVAAKRRRRAVIA
jgi:uncharacterized surface anchored protein